MSGTPSTPSPDGQLWSDKYRPRSLAEMCYPVCANKLLTWLQTFEAAQARRRGSPPKKSGGGGTPAGLLLSGPPGVGKTTAVHLAAAAAGYQVLEFNASDFRSGKALREGLAALPRNRTFAADAAQGYTPVVLLMDEVDGCDVGGVAVLIAYVDQGTVPVVCTCNDAWHPKLRSLRGHVEELRFSRPPHPVVTRYLRERVLAREGVRLPAELLQDVVRRAGNDLRAMLNNLQLWARGATGTGTATATLDEAGLARWAGRSRKDRDVGLFDTATALLMPDRGDAGALPGLAAMADLASRGELVDLFVQENYLHFGPAEDGAGWLAGVTRAAAAIALADGVTRRIYQDQHWALSRVAVCLGCVAPCVYTRGRYHGFVTGPQAAWDRQRPVKFPSWLGQHAAAGRHQRWARALTAQTGRRRTGDQAAVVLDYVPLGWTPGVWGTLARHGRDGIPAALARMTTYQLGREDVEWMATVGHFKRRRGADGGDVFAAIPAPLKSAFTRAFHRTHPRLSLARVALRHLDPGSPTGADDGLSDTDAETEAADEAATGRAEDLILPATASKTPVGAPAARGKAGEKTAAKPRRGAAPRTRAQPPSPNGQTKESTRRSVKKPRRAARKESSSEDSFVASDSDED